MRYERNASRTARTACWVAVLLAAVALSGRGRLAGCTEADAQNTPAQNKTDRSVDSPDVVSAASRDGPMMQREAVFIGTVQRGTMLRQVRGVGTLVPEQSLMIYPAIGGRIQRIHVMPGAPVKADTVLMTLTNPELEQSLKDAEFQLRAAQVEMARLQAQFESEALEYEAALTSLKSELAQAQMAEENAPKAPDKESPSASAAKGARGRTGETAIRSEERRLKASADSTQAWRQLQKIELERSRSLWEFKRSQVQGLQVRAGMDGIVRRIGGSDRLQDGQAVTPNTVLATVIQPAKLRAELAIPDPQSGEIQIGQPAVIDTHAGKVSGRVAGIDPVVAVSTETVTVYVTLEGELPKGVRPGSKVEGAVEIEKLTNILYMPRPASGEANQQVSLFKLVDAGKSAVRTPVKLGRSSTAEIEVLEGLQAGDQIILSDISSAAESSRIQLR